MFKNCVVFFVLFLSVSCLNARDEITLRGEWMCELKSAGDVLGVPIPVILPGSLDENGVGGPNPDITDQHLSTALAYVGPVDFTRSIFIPADWAGRHVVLHMERTKVTDVWVNGVHAGHDDVIYSFQGYDLGEMLKSGEANEIRIRVNNDPKLVPVDGSHAYAVDTQTNWNGILGHFALIAKDPMHIAQFRITPDVEARCFKVSVRLSQDVEPGSEISLLIESVQNVRGAEPLCDKALVPLPVLPAGAAFEAVLPLSDAVATWSDTSPATCTVNVSLERDSSTIDTVSTTTGLREFEASPDGFTINGNLTFLRGKHEAGVFPLTGYMPMDVESWMRVMGIAKAHGINFYRFHSLTPPEAAFEAADRLGIYIQSELPIWWGFDDKNEAQIAYLLKLGRDLLDAYGNHPSFVMLSLGNEITKDRDVLRGMVDALREHDPRPLYAQGSNNHLWDPRPGDHDDFFCAMRTGAYAPDGSTDARLSMSYADSEGEGGLLNSRHPSTTINFDRAMERSPMPFEGFEVGQYQVFPNFEELTKYTGVVKPYNLQMYRDRLEAAGMLDQAQDFFLASGALSVLGYRADIEAMLRTERFSGFNLLDLQDYPGQGTALVGMLDAFMDSKGLIRPDEFRRFCDSVVLLLEQEKYSWTDAETYTANVKIRNHGALDIIRGSIRWVLRDGRNVVASGTLGADSPAFSGLRSADSTISIPLAGIHTPSRLDLDLFLDGTRVRNSYPIWVFASERAVEIPVGVTISGSLDDETVSVLNKGGTVLLFPAPAAIEAHSTANQFISDFWNWQMFANIARQFGRKESAGTLGLLIDPLHPAVSAFPTDFHTDYQWWPIVTGSRALILDEMPRGYRPVVQVIDNISRMHKLGLVCEFRTAGGRLLVCTSALPEKLEYPEVRQFFRSLLQYAASPAFQPSCEVPLETLKGMGL